MGKLINLVSLDGAGKSTQIKLITDYLTNDNYDVASLHFPTYTSDPLSKQFNNTYSDLIERFLRGEFGDISEVDPYFVANIYAMDRFTMKYYLEELLDDNDYVILDRYSICNIAYQSAKFNDYTKSNEIRKWIYDFEFNFLGLPKPDLTLFLDVPTHIIKERLNNDRSNLDNKEYLKDSKVDIHEKNINYQSKVRDQYIRLKDFLVQRKMDYEIIDTVDNKGLSLSPEEIFATYKWVL